MSLSGVVDLRSDTVTRPTPGMRRAMAEAEVGDDVFGEDPTIHRLEERVADLLGKEASIFVPSGTMANQTVIRSQTEPGDEILVHRDSHICHFESGAPAALSGCSLRLLDGDRGIFDAAAVRAAARRINSHFPNSALIVVENTHNRGGGTIWPIETIAAIAEVANEHGLKMHLDGARLLNACVATSRAPSEYTAYFNTVSTCFSKGLGAPVGSAVAGDAATIKRVHRFRKMFGGGMRQAGILAAAALYALDHHVDRLAEDHANARWLAEALANIPNVSIEPDAVETNILFFQVADTVGSAESVCAALKEQGVLMLPEGDGRIRAVTHLDVSRQGVERAISAVNHVVVAKCAASG